MSDPPTSSHSNAPPEFVDVPYTRFQPLTHTFVVCAVMLGGVVVAGIVVALTTELAKTALFSLVAAGTIGIALYAVYRFLVVRFCSRLHRAVFHPPDRPLTAIWKETLAPWSMLAVAKRLDLLVRALRASGRMNVTIRNCPPTYVRTIEPVGTPFEARPLDEADASFVELQNALECAPNTGRASPPPDGRPSDGPAVRRLRRNITFAGGWLFLTIVGIVAAAQTMQVWLRWEATLSALLCGSFFFYLLFGIGTPKAGSGNIQRFIVPGGLLARRTKRDGSWELHLFDRSNSVLIAHCARRASWTLFVADSDFGDSLELTATEAELALRAWLSPLSPPSVERLSDLV